jgi:thiopeptide-type bacteriocin biosynthesis protein
MTSLAVLSIDHLLADLGLTPADRVAWYRGREAAKTASGREYRQRKDALRRLLGDAEHLREQRGGDALARVLGSRSEQLAPVGRRIDATESARELSVRKLDLISSYVHLHINRLMASNWQQEELVIGLLGRTRQSLGQSALSARPDDEQ